MATCINAGSKNRPLTPKQAVFAQEYLLDLNATQAATRAGYNHHTAKEQGARLLTNVNVKEYIKHMINDRSQRLQRDADAVLRDLAVVRIHGMAIVKNEDGRSVMVNANAALKALELEGRHLKMFTDKVEATGQDGGPINHSITVRFVGAK